MEKLYNNIIIEDNFCAEPSDAQHVPYLETPPEIIDVSVGRQLFVDDFLIEETDLAPEYHKAQKFEGNPILTPDMPWEQEMGPVACPKSGGVWYDEEEHIFKMWYSAGWLKNECYAISKDGIHWERPALDEEGTNQILKYEGYDPDKWYGGVEYFRPDSTTVAIDYNAPKSEKYKLLLRNPVGMVEKGLGSCIVATSADGIQFENFKYTSYTGDRTTIFYNPFRKKWVYSIRAGWEVRVRHYRECDDFMEGATWKPEEEHEWLMCDELDHPDPYIGFDPQLYCVDCIGYESIILGMFEIMYGPENGSCEKYGTPKITELIPMYSRDGYHFSRPTRESIINASMYKGSWDRGYVQSVGGVMIIHGDELWIYYTGFAGDDQYGDFLPWQLGNGMYRNGATGLAKLRRDGFVSMNGEGTLLTRKLQFSGKESMHINAIGKVFAEIMDENGNLLGTSSVFEGDSTNAELTFEDLHISDLNDKVIRIKFYVEGKIYAFGFADKDGDFGGAHAAGVVK